MHILAIFLSSLSLIANDIRNDGKDTLTLAPAPRPQEEVDDSATLQNAESSSIPREIPIGLPESSTGAVITEDGLKMAHTAIRDYFHWAGGNAYASTRIMGLAESLIRTGDVGMVVDSRSRTGSDITAGALSARTSTNGLIRFDGAVSGALSKAKGWYYSFGAYVNMDPTSVNAPTRKFVDQKQIYKAVITKRWARAEVSAMAKVSLCSDNAGNAYSKAPFIYNGDGTTSEFNGFRLGRDCYFPEDDKVTYKDVITGQTITDNLAAMDSKRIYDFHVNAEYRLNREWSLGANLQFCHTPHFNTVENTMGGVVKASSAAYSYSDGTPYKNGYVQLRLATPHNNICTDFMGLVSAKKKTASNTLDMGFMFSAARLGQHTSSFYYAHTAEANPQRIYLDGKSTWKINSNAMYFDASLVDFTIYATDEWNVTDRLFLRGGIRLMTPIFNVSSVANGTDPATGQMETKYDRYDGFSLADLKAKGIAPATYTQKDIDGLPLDFHISAYASYKLSEGLFLLGEGFYSKINKTTNQFKGNKIPSMKPVGYAMGRVGINMERKWARNRTLECSIIGSYIGNWNNAGFSTISNPSRTIQSSYVYEYGIGTWGITFDSNLTAGAFSLHALVSLQDPRYKNYSHTEHFDDGSTTIVDFSGKYVTNISKWRIELSPTFDWDKWRVAGSVRYFSRQYASKNNLAYFNGRFETFFSAGWKFHPSCMMSLNVVNFLMQSGAKGTIAASDAAASESDIAGVVMCGSYLLPFTVDLGLSYKF